MTSNTDARTEVLARIRAAKAGADGDAAAGWNSIARDYHRQSDLGSDAVLELFEDRLREYNASVFRVESARVKSAIESRLRERGCKRLLVPDGMASQWLPEGFDFDSGAGLSASELDGYDGVLTTATIAIAVTGTIVLQNAPGQGRRAVTLVPDYHLCLLRAEQVVQTVPQAFAALSSSARLATTFISGPSATADIEMTRIKGVHGPRFLDVMLIHPE